jgi:hypothetical protein
LFGAGHSKIVDIWAQGHSFIYLAKVGG